MRRGFAVLAAVGVFAGGAWSQQPSDSHVPITDWGGSTNILRDPAELAKQMRTRLNNGPLTPNGGLEEELLKRVKDMLLKDDGTLEKIMRGEKTDEKGLKQALDKIGLDSDKLKQQLLGKDKQ